MHFGQFSIADKEDDKLGCSIYLIIILSGVK